MEKPTKFYNSIKELQRAATILKNYQKTHNIIRNDYIELLNLAESLLGNENQFNALYRACMRELFSLIESDLFGLNQLDKYNGYKDQEGLVKKFEKTFVQISQTWSKNDLWKGYFDEKFENLKKIKIERDRTTHPKKPEDFKQISLSDFNILKAIFHDYDNFINELMNGFFIGLKLPY